jgi:nucleotidyltransferase/DNA polymerase involved in DNA repair
MLPPTCGQTARDSNSGLAAARTGRNQDRIDDKVNGHDHGNDNQEVRKHVVSPVFARSQPLSAESNKTLIEKAPDVKSGAKSV